MKVGRYDLNPTFWKTVGALIVLAILACTKWAWLWIPVGVVVGIAALVLFLFWGFKRWGSP